jgi:hypothetical protein
MEVNINIELLPALLRGGTLYIYEFGWFSELFCTLLRIEKALAATRARSTDRPTGSVVAQPTLLSRILQ